MSHPDLTTQALGSRFIICLFMLTASAVTGQLCLPDCGYDRLEDRAMQDKLEN